MMINTAESREDQFGLRKCQLAEDKSTLAYHQTERVKVSPRWNGFEFRIAS
jgi:hypothetical protein